jgi:hypothetical protein
VKCEAWLNPQGASGAAQIGCALQPTDPCHSFLQILAYVQLFIGAVISSALRPSRLAIIRPSRTISVLRTLPSCRLLIVNQPTDPLHNRALGNQSTRQTSPHRCPSNRALPGQYDQLHVTLQHQTTPALPLSCLSGLQVLSHNFQERVRKLRFGLRIRHSQHVSPGSRLAAGHRCNQSDLWLY